MHGERKQIHFTRRDFIRWSARLAGGLVVTPILQACQRLGWIPAAETPQNPATVPVPTLEIPSTPTPVVTITPQTAPTVTAGIARIAFVCTRDRGEGIRRALALLGQVPLAGKRVLLKPNFNSADPAPASTHPDTLRALVESLKEMGASAITVADRSGMGD